MSLSCHLQPVPKCLPYKHSGGSVSTRETMNETLIPLTKPLGNPVHCLSFLCVRTLPLPLRPHSSSSLCESFLDCSFICLSTRLFTQPLQLTGHLHPAGHQDTDRPAGPGAGPPDTAGETSQSRAGRTVVGTCRMHGSLWERTSGKWKSMWKRKQPHGALFRELHGIPRRLLASARRGTDGTRGWSGDGRGRQRTGGGGPQLCRVLKTPGQVLFFSQLLKSTVARHNFHTVGRTYVSVKFNEF